MLPRVLGRCNTTRGFRTAQYALRPDTAASADFSGKIATAFVSNPELTGKQILGSLGPEERLRLLSILHSQNGTALPEPAIQAASRITAPSSRALGALALAAGVPFIAFGFMDNAIMANAWVLSASIDTLHSWQIMAGEEIENVFGARFGLSTLAAAGLGNLISDVIGIGTAEPVQAKFNKWFPMKPLTGQQQILWQSRAAKFGGSAAGVSLGCLLGMAPLLFLDGHKGKNGKPPSEQS